MRLSLRSWQYLFAALAWLAAATAVAPAVAALPAQGEREMVVVPTRTVPVGSIVEAGDVALMPAQHAAPTDVLRELSQVVGMEAQRSLYAGRMIREREIGPVTLVERNSRVVVRFRQGPIELTTYGRALEKGGLGEIIRVLNLDSRRSVYGRIVGPEVVDVGS